MLRASEWFRRFDALSKPWLIVGKGPSYRKLANVNLAEHNVLALNHVSRDVRFDIALMMDLEVAEALGEALANNARFVFVPWHPHKSNAPSARTALEYLADYPILRRLESE